MRKPPPIRTIRSIWSCVAIRSPSRRSASSVNGRAHAVGDEADRVGGANRLAAHRLGHLAGDRQRLLGGLVAGDHLDQAHQRGRVEEVHAADALGPLHPGGDRGHRERGGVGGQDRLGSADAGEPREQLALQLQVLGRSLDHQLAAGQVLQPRRCAKAGRCGLGLGLRPAAAVGSLHQRRAKPSASPSLERRGDRVVQVGVEAAQAGELGDPGAHRSGAHDPDALDHGVSCSAPKPGGRVRP